MTPKQLLAYFDRIAEAPGAVPRLRGFILDLAVRGKLVEQDAEDEPVEFALGRSDSVRQDAAREDRRADSERQDLLAEEHRWAVPSSWKWRGLGDLVLFIDYRGQTPSKASGGVRLITAKNVKDGFISLAPEEFVTENTYHHWMTRGLPKAGDVLFTTEAPMGNAAVVHFTERFALAQRVICFRCYGAADSEFLTLQLLASPFQLILARVATGLTAKGIKAAKLKRLPIALPPLAEQHRIVAKVDELMVLCDRLEVAQAERERRRALLVSTSASVMQNVVVALCHQECPPASLVKHLLAHSDSGGRTETLRKAILHLAVRGRLVPQSRQEESSVSLLSRIEKPTRPARWQNRSLQRIQGDCGLSVGEPTLSVPQGWTWVSLPEVARLESGHTPSRNRPDWWDGDVPWVGLVDARLHNGGTIYSTRQYTNEEGLANSAARLLPIGTVCISRTASVGYVVILGKPMATSQDFVNWVPTEAVTSRWLQLVFTAELGAMKRFSKGTVHQTIYYPEWLAMNLALPPLGEQHRIAAKVDELMSLCDRLETQLATVQAESSRLLEAVLHEALEEAGASTRERVAH